MISNLKVQNKMRMHCNLFGAKLLGLTVGDFQLPEGTHEALSCLNQTTGQYFLFNLFTDVRQRDFVVEALIRKRCQNVTLTCERTMDEELIRFIVRCAYERTK